MKKTDKSQNIDNHCGRAVGPAQTHARTETPYVHEKTSSKSIVDRSKKWKLLLNKVKLHAHKKHNFKNRLMRNKKINYIRLNIFPDGGISRIRVLGRAE